MGTNDDIIIGYDPKQYRRMTILFVILSVINMGMVLLAFMRSGYGLYHAEDALSHIAKITQCVQSVNEDALDIITHSNNRKLVENEVNDISDMFKTIDSESKDYLAINLDGIDEKLRGDFNNSSGKVERYRKALDSFTADVINDISHDSPDDDSISKVLAVYTINVEPLKQEAEVSMNELFEFQNKATYDFFVRCAQQFLFVLLFLIVTMTVGILGIRRMRKNAKNSAETAAEEHRKAVSSQNKAINIAYSNIITGLKNRYALEEDFVGTLSDKRFTIAIFNFPKFDTLNEMYGRSAADEFLSSKSQYLLSEFEELADIYSTKSSEFCFVFKERMVSNVQAEKRINSIMEVLSEPMEIGDVTVQLNVACSYCEYKPNMNTSFNRLFISMDRTMANAKQNSSLTSTNTSMRASILQ